MDKVGWAAMSTQKLIIKEAVAHTMNKNSEDLLRTVYDTLHCISMLTIPIL
jgi:hypothetical protein